MNKREKELLRNLSKFYLYAREHTEQENRVDLGILYTEIRDELKELFTS